MFTWVGSSVFSALLVIAATIVVGLKRIDISILLTLLSSSLYKVFAKIFHVTHDYLIEGNK